MTIIEQDISDSRITNANIKNQKRIISKYLEDSCNTFNLRIDNISTFKLNRNYLINLIKNNYTNYSGLKAFEMIINQGIRESYYNPTLSRFNRPYKFSCDIYPKLDNVIHISSLINDIITNNLLISSDSVEGYVYSDGFKHIKDVLVIKMSKIQNDLSLIHEYFIGINLNELRKQIPNFMYTYGIFNCNYDINTVTTTVNAKLCDCNGPNCEKNIYVIYENINGIQLEKFITNFSNLIDSNKYNINLYDLISIFTQILLSLQMANEKFKYNHLDLHTGNIVIKQLPDYKCIKYTITDTSQLAGRGVSERKQGRLVEGDTQGSSQSKNIYVLSNCVATIIDYGYSGIEMSNITYKSKLLISNNKDIEWTKNVYEGNGIDILKLISSIRKYSGVENPKVLKSNINNNIKVFWECIKETFDNLGFTKIYEITNLAYGYPKKFDSKFLNLKCIDYLNEFYNCLSKKNIDYKNVIYEELPNGYNLFNTDFTQKPNLNNDIIDEIDKLITPSISASKDFNCSEYDWLNNDTWYKDNGKIGNIKDCIKIYKDDKFNIFNLPINYNLYSSNIDIILNNYDYTNMDPKSSNTIPKIFSNLEVCKKHSKTSNYGNYGAITAYKLDNNCICYDFSDENNYIEIEKMRNSFNKKYNIIDNDFINSYKDLYDDIKRDGGYIINSDFINYYNLINMNFLKYLFEYLYELNIFIIYIPVILPNEKYINDCFIVNNYASHKKFISRNTNNIYDFQYFDNTRLYGKLKHYINDLKRYEYIYNPIGLTDNEYKFNPYNTGVWSTLYLQDMIENSILSGSTQGVTLSSSNDFDKTINKIISEIDKNYIILMIISSFLHTIGYGGTLNYNNLITKDNYINNLNRYLIDKNDYIFKIDNIQDLYVMDIDLIIKDMNISNQKDINTIYILILSIPITVELLKSLDINFAKKKYIKELFQIIVKLKIKINKSDLNLYINNIVRMSIIVTLSIIYGSNQYIDIDLNNKIKDINSKMLNYNTRLNKYVLDYPILTNIYNTNIPNKSIGIYNKKHNDTYVININEIIKYINEII